MYHINAKTIFIYKAFICFVSFFWAIYSFVYLFVYFHYLTLSIIPTRLIVPTSCQRVTQLLQAVRQNSRTLNIPVQAVLQTDLTFTGRCCVMKVSRTAVTTRWTGSIRDIQKYQSRIKASTIEETVKSVALGSTISPGVHYVHIGGN